MLSRKAQFFFVDAKDLVAVSDLITSLAAGNQIRADRVPACLLPCVTLLTTIGLRRFDQQIVDDYALLIDRLKEVWREPNFTHAEFFHRQLFLVSCVANEGPRGEFDWDGVPEAQYMFEVYEELVNADLEEILQ